MSYDVSPQYYYTYSPMTKMSYNNNSLPSNPYPNDESLPQLSLATRAIDNITEVHTGYLNARPLSDDVITPNKRYDSALIPYKLLSRSPGKQVPYTAVCITITI